MSITIAPMNLLLKGSAISIQKALADAELPEYELQLFSYTPDHVDPTDTSIKMVGLVFIEEKYISVDKLPFAFLPDVKFICMGDGEDNGCSDGTYAIFKDFGDTSVCVCYRFSTKNPHMEEFEDQCEVIDQVRNSFLNQPWVFEYEDYSCGEFLEYAFNADQDLSLIALWEDDSRYNCEGCYDHVAQTAIEFFSVEEEDDYDEENCGQIEDDGLQDEVKILDDFSDDAELSFFSWMHDGKQKKVALLYRNAPQQTADGIMLTGRLEGCDLRVGDQLSLSLSEMTYITHVRMIVKAGSNTDHAHIGDVITLHYDNYEILKVPFSFKPWKTAFQDQYGVFISGTVVGDSISVGEKVKIIRQNGEEAEYVVCSIVSYMRSVAIANPGDDIKLYLENFTTRDFSAGDTIAKG